ncbi:MAG TPA: amidohydrolase family protein [Chloroflexota bacterium]|nr:amidohydrolase family protein [Chloroflexota bacterium]
MTTQRVIDADVHCTVPNARALFPYLSEYWIETIEQTGFNGATDNYYPNGSALSARPGSVPESGPAGSNLDLLRSQVLDAQNVELAILNCAYAVDGVKNPYGAAAMASAANDWISAEWLEKEPRLRASIVVPSHYPDLAVKEIDRVGGHPGFVQVFLPGRSERPYGNRRYFPIFEAIVRHDLVAGIQFGGAPGVPPTASGWPTYYAEEAVGMSHVFQTQLTSLIAEGTFAEFPDLRVTMVEGGWTWLPSLMWRMDKNWKALRREIPWTTMAPSDYIREHVRFTTQPVDAPANPKHLRQIVDQLGSDDLLMYSTDYPHWHAEEPESILSIALSEERIQKIMSENARAWYRLT